MEINGLKSDLNAVELATGELAKKRGAISGRKGCSRGKSKSRIRMRLLERDDKSTNYTQIEL